MHYRLHLSCIVLSCILFLHTDSVSQSEINFYGAYHGDPFFRAARAVSVKADALPDPALKTAIDLEL